jgi:PTH1 family peptidyl-tRNA hydrolase
MAEFLIVGLGNIGTEYAGTRHNIGFTIAEAFALKHGVFFKPDRFTDIAEVKLKGKKLLVIKPTTYMNLSGRAVKYWLDKEKIPLENLLVVVDDIALPLTKLRLRPAGSHAGHNGLKSIQDILGTDAYPKLRFGIGNDYPRGEQIDYVLGSWKPSEWPLVQYKLQKSVEVIEDFISRGIERTMTEVNKKEFIL